MIKPQSLNLFFSISLIVLTVSGCSRNPPQSNRQANDPPTAQNTSQLNQVVAKNHVVTLLKDNQLQLLSPADKMRAPVTTLNPQTLPPDLSLESFILSPSHQYIAWYNPAQGIFVLDTATQQTTPVFKPTKWFNSFPHLQTHPNNDWLFFIDDDGTRLHRIALDTKEHQSTAIPHPFGTRFVISPNGFEIAFISGFQQDQETATYMITTIDGSNPRRFTTEVELADRHLIAWEPDSNGIYVIENGNTVTHYPGQDTGNPQILVTVPADTGRITDLHRVDNLLYLQTSRNQWQVYQLPEASRIAQVPQVIAQELNQPRFIPWYDRSFLIEETIKTPETQYRRLWHTTFKGVKHILVEKYQETQVETTTPEI